MMLSTKLFRTVQFLFFLLAHEWKFIKSGSELLWKILWYIRTRIIQNVPNPTPVEGKNGPSAINPSNLFVFITKFGFRPIRITRNSWNTLTI